MSGRLGKKKKSGSADSFFPASPEERKPFIFSPARLRSSPFLFFFLVFPVSTKVVKAAFPAGLVVVVTTICHKCLKSQGGVVGSGGEGGGAEVKVHYTLYTG